MKRLFGEIDRTLAFVGMVSSLLMTIWFAVSIGRAVYIAVGALTFVACTCYVIIRKTGSLSVVSSSTWTEIPNQLHLTLNVLFFGVFVYSLFSFYLRPDPYVVPLAYFVCMTIMIGLLSVEILFLPSRETYFYFALAKIILIGISAEFSQLLVFPSILGVDPRWHQVFTLSLLKEGYVPSGYVYSHFPFMHLLISSTSLITGLDYKFAAMLSVSLPQVLCNTSFVSLLGCFLFNKKVGLLGGLLLAVANFEVYMGFAAIPNTMGSIFAFAAMYILLKTRKQKNARANLSIATLMMAALILTHTVTSAWLSIVLFAIWAGSSVYYWIHRERERLVSFLVPLFFFVGMFSYWSIASGTVTTLGEWIRWGLSKSYFGYGGSEAMRYAIGVPTSEQLFNVMGISLFFAISFVGCLHMISYKCRNPNSFVIATCGAMSLFIGFFASISGLGILEDRWFYLSQILLAIPVGAAILLLSSNAKRDLQKILVVVPLILCISFLMILSPVANLSNSTFSPNTQVRYALTKSEMQAIETVSRMRKQDIGSDSYYSDLDGSRYPSESLERQIFDGNFSDCRDFLVMIRESIINNPAFFTWGIDRLNYDPREALTVQGYSRIYDSRSVSSFVYSGH